jgi:SAM-dependent methyltransferase
MKSTCPLCGGASSPLFRVHGYDLLECSACRHQFAALGNGETHVGRVYRDEYFQGGGAGYPDYLAEAPILKEHGRRYAKLMERFSKPGRLLDVGSAAGFILSGFVESGWSGCGVEPNASMADYAREQLGIPVFQGTLEDFRDDSAFDLVNLIQVLAHFVDPVRALERAAALTKAGGFWLIETWDRESWTARLTGRRWHEYSPPSVLHWFTPKSVAELAGRFGFREVARGRPSKKLSAAHAKSLLGYKLGPRGVGRLVERIVNFIPDAWTLPYPAEDLFWLVCRKESAMPHATSRCLG